MSKRLEVKPAELRPHRRELHLDAPAVAPDSPLDRSQTQLRRNRARLALGWTSRTWAALDFVVAGSGFILAHWLSPEFSFLNQAHNYSVTAATLVFAVLLVFCNCILGVYDRHHFTSVSRMLGQTLLANTLAIAITCLAFSWIRYVPIGRWIVLGTIVISGGGTFCLRMTARGLARKAKIRLLLVGPRHKFRSLTSQIRLMYSEFYARPSYVELSGKSVKDRRLAFSEAFDTALPDEVIVMDGDPALPDVLCHASMVLKSGCAIFTFASYCENLLGELPVEVVDDRGILGTGYNVGSFHSGLVKRPLDVFLAAIAIVLCSPLVGLCALLIKLCDSGPILYRQVRVGRYGRPFVILKFRTMREDAEIAGARWASTADDRVTRLGKILRKTRLDELPQLWNVLIGHMSLVGPRPERPEFVEKLKRQVPHYELRQLVQPGLTGWAQIKFRYGASISDSQRKLAFDLYYVRHCSLWFDVVIWLRTIAAVAKGAR